MLVPVKVSVVYRSGYGHAVKIAIENVRRSNNEDDDHV
jgi:hypothetical protein